MYIRMIGSKNSVPTARNAWGTASAVRRGRMVTLIGPEFTIDNLAAASKSTGREVLSHLGRRLHRVYYVT